MDGAVKERSLAIYLAAFAAALTVPLLLLAAFLTWRYTQAEGRQLEAGALQRSENVAAEIDRLLSARLAILRVLATSPAIDAGDVARFDSQAREFAAMGIDIRLRRLDGQLLVDTSAPPGSPLPSWSVIAPIGDAITGKGPVFSDLFVSRGTATYAVAIFLPVIRGGEVVSVVSTTFSPEVFTRMMADFGVAAPFYATLADREGLIIARSSRHAELMGRPLPAFDMLTGSGGTWRGVNPDGVEVSALYSRLPSSGWLLSLGVDVVALDRALWQSLGWMLLVAVALIGVATVMATLIVRRLARANATMTDAAVAMERGQLTMVPRTDVAEVNRVGEAFGRASVRLHLQASALARANRELEQRVEQRGLELRASEERYRLLAENARDMILLRTVEGRIFYASPSAHRLLGYTADELMEARPVTLVHPDDWARVEAIIRALGEGRDLGFSIHRLRHKEGHWVWIQAAYSRIDGVGPDEPNIMVVVRDDTERQDQETKLRQTNEALRQFSAIVSHDLQAPLRHINMFSDMLKAKIGDADAEAAGYASNIMASVERMQRLIRSLIAYTQVAYALVKREEVDLGAVVREAVALLDADITAAGASIKVFNLPQVEGDSDLLARLFQNLVGNAVKYRGEEPLVVKIRARPAGRMWEISVEDNGIGIDPLYSERIFEIFRRLHRDESRYPGLGLGLALCRRIVESHGGEIWLDKDWPKGARFQLTLPRQRDNKNRPEGGDDARSMPETPDR
ncbi:MAG: PAS domain S-box protein [Phreatobacter sp.]|uniref:sensor histidine kinase n=1 Tax=Phreatobacter sp. TaxID=1966341 RepID=UPI0027329E28|nr:ATP-binding protein [Phreatobacter sp.]MDP2800891.1 PAS domain S-box protein [Phreatobacter sp.]